MQVVFWLGYWLEKRRPSAFLYKVRLRDKLPERDPPSPPKTAKIDRYLIVFTFPKPRGFPQKRRYLAVTM
jgi:hypothetical protein